MNLELTTKERNKNRLKPSQPLITNLSSTSPELHFLLDFAEQDKQYNGWTTRVSWPGSASPPYLNLIYPPPYPTRISITPPDSSLHISISGTPLSPRMPHPLLSYLPSPLKPIFSSTQAQSQSQPHSIQINREEGFITPISIILEPLILGMIPRTAIPTVYLILLGILIAGLSLPRAFRLIEYLINQFNDDELRGTKKVE
uniref:Uncharacterized protein n=1 Tax=Kwoniella bestiolae CBS 10118 TaxID=1296100 RepID=A0A1B9FV01_9TREE|nr:hypothetical protein I302_08243 [Kwoniella bestiolae CBS 10118]OCF22593.1 hypothetical protein I302_08243 [Kwoniella bestiolae CBS 10118]